MEQLQETYEAGGFVFRTKKEAELAQREIEGTKYLRQKLDMENPNAVFFHISESDRTGFI